MKKEFKKEMEDLENAEKQIMRTLRIVRNQMNELKTSNILPKLKKKFEGKCFKFNNSYGRDSAPWWLYIRVRKITNADFCDTIELQITSHGEAILKKKAMRTLSMYDDFKDYTPIPLSEFKRALKKQTDWMLAHTKKDSL